MMDFQNKGKSLVKVWQNLRQVEFTLNLLPMKLTPEVSMAPFFEATPPAFHLFEADIFWILL